MMGNPSSSTDKSWKNLQEQNYALIKPTFYIYLGPASHQDLTVFMHVHLHGRQAHYYLFTSYIKMPPYY